MPSIREALPFLEKELSNHPDQNFVDKLLTGIKHGFDTGIDPVPPGNFVCKNNLSARRNPEETHKLIQKELNNGYLIGPFQEPPFDHFRINPLSLAEKKYSAKKRLVVDMSAPHNGDTASINSLISKEDFKLSYVKIDEAIKIIQTVGRGAWLCKTDLVDAFKNLPVHPRFIPFQGIAWDNQFYFWTRLCFGCRSSPALFNLLSEAIVWIAQQNYGIVHCLHLLDDFLTIDSSELEGQRTMAIFLMIIRKLKLSWAPHKTVGPAQQLEYLGILIDTVSMECRLPQDKLFRMRNMVSTFLGRTKCTQQEMLSLIGHLVFAARVIPAGRSFLSRLFTAAHSVQRLHHRVYISAAAKEDLLMWSRFLNGWDGISLFLDLQETSAPCMQLYTDASGTIGFGGIYQTQWFYGAWSDDLLKGLDKSVSISFQELYPIVVAAILWGKFWARKRVQFHCDNEGTVFVLNKGRSKSPDIMKLMRKLTLVAAQNSFAYRACHIPGNKNCVADALSRLQMDRFRLLAPMADALPCQIPSNIMSL
jgi:hypothetical protein